MKKVLSSLLTILAFTNSALAEPIALSDYLAEMDRKEVHFSGSIKFGSIQDTFTFYDGNGVPYGATIDAGRDTREKIESECENESMFFSVSELCKISGTGTIEIRGSTIYISIDSVEFMSK